MILNPSGAETRRQHSGIVETNRSSACSLNAAHELGAHLKKGRRALHRRLLLATAGSIFGAIACVKRAAASLTKSNQNTLLTGSRASSHENMPSYAGAKRTHNHRGEAWSWQGTHSTRKSLSPNRRPRTRHETYCGNRCRIHLQRKQCWMRGRKESQSKRPSYRSPPFDYWQHPWEARGSLKSRARVARRFAPRASEAHCWPMPAEPVRRLRLRR